MMTNTRHYISKKQIHYILRRQKSSDERKFAAQVRKEEPAYFKDVRESPNEASESNEQRFI